MDGNRGSKIQEIMERPTTVNQVHESIYRSYHILDYVEWLLANDTPPAVVLKVMNDLRRMGNTALYIVNGQEVTEVEYKRMENENWLNRHLNEIADKQEGQGE